MESFAKNGGKLVPIAPQNAQWAVVEDYNKTNPDNQVKLVASEDFQPADAYTWVLEGRYDGYFNIELAYKNNVEAENGAYHKFADKLSYVRYKAIPTYPLFNKKDQKLADEYDAAIKKLQDSGKILELENKYFGEDIFKYIKK
jgi:L-cystine transport system substrate-binding protein